MNDEKFYFFDMDGTIVEYRRDADVEKMKQPGYFYNLKPEWNMILAMKLLKSMYPNQVFVLTTVYPNELTYSVREKVLYRDKIIPFMKDNFIMVNGDIGETKQNKVESIVGGPINENCLLIDDYSVNLKSWEESGGRPVKYKNGINNNNNTPHKYSVNCYMDPETVVATLLKF